MAKIPELDHSDFLFMRSDSDPVTIPKYEDDEDEGDEAVPKNNRDMLSSVARTSRRLSSGIGVEL